MGYCPYTDVLHNDWQNNSLESLKSTLLGNLPGAMQLKEAIKKNGEIVIKVITLD